MNICNIIIILCVKVRESIELIMGGVVHVFLLSIAVAWPLSQVLRNIMIDSTGFIAVGYDFKG